MFLLLPSSLLSRRACLRVLGGLTSALVIGFSGLAYAWGKEAPLVLEALPASQNPLLFEPFLTLIRLILARPFYPAKDVHPFYDAFINEAWGAHHMGGIYTKLYALQQTRGRSDNLWWRDVMNNLDAGERWFMDHLLTTFYLGIYYHQDQPAKRMTRAEALMHDATRVLAIPVPYISNTGFNAWATPPIPNQR